MATVTAKDVLEFAPDHGLTISGIAGIGSVYFLRIGAGIYAATRDSDQVRFFRAPGAALRAFGQLPTPTPEILRGQNANHAHFCLHCDCLIDVISPEHNDCNSNHGHDFELCGECQEKKNADDHA